MLLNKFQSKLSSVRMYLRTSTLKIFNRSDCYRWSNINNFSSSWDARTKQIADMIKPGNSVIEFGAGRLVLKNLLPIECSYTPSDFVDRGEGTIICDLNRKVLPDFPRHDVAVFSGVIEYINDIHRVIVHLSNYVNVIILSYEATDTSNIISKYERRSNGWVNDYNSIEIVELFTHAGFSCVLTQRWKSQIICKFEK